MTSSRNIVSWFPPESWGYAVAFTGCLIKWVKFIKTENLAPVKWNGKWTCRVDDMMKKAHETRYRLLSDLPAPPIINELNKKISISLNPNEILTIHHYCPFTSGDYSVLQREFF